MPAGSRKKHLSSAIPIEAKTVVIKSDVIIDKSKKAVMLSKKEKENENKGKNAIALIRVSKPSGQCLDIQRKIVEQYIQSQGLTCTTVHEYRGSSYHLSYSKLITQLILMLNNDDIGHLVVHTADRLTRSMISFTQLLGGINKHIVLHFVEEGIKIPVTDFFPPTVKACEVYNAINAAQTFSAVLSSKMKSHHRILEYQLPTSNTVPDTPSPSPPSKTLSPSSLPSTKTSSSSKTLSSPISTVTLDGISHRRSSVNDKSISKSNDERQNEDLKNLICWLHNTKRFNCTVICNLLNCQNVYCPFVLDKEKDYMVWTPKLVRSKKYLDENLGVKQKPKSFNWFQIKIKITNKRQYNDIIDIRNIKGSKYCKVSYTPMYSNSADITNDNNNKDHTCWVPSQQFIIDV
jgi:hypothetical protein